jgi:NAD(P)-dependent dehydrogenase (short-subunit alcohol dehydrogenase family)
MEPPAKVSLVTGSARGLGLAVARRLRARGERVHVTWRSEGASADALRAEFGARAHRADLLAPLDAEGLVRAVLEVDGRLDHAVHAVGEYVSGTLAETTAADLRRMLASNVESAFAFFGAARAALRASRGRAVFFGTSGLAGFRARRRTAAYAAAKSALLLLVKSWALEEAPHGVTVNLISPGHVPHPHAHPRHARRRAPGRDPARPPGHARGRRARGGLPAVGRRQLHHRLRAARQRRLDAVSGRGRRYFGRAVPSVISA